MKLRKVTMKDIARATGVSPSTVSRALNNDPRISEETRERIQRLAREMGYTPSIRPQGLSVGRTNLIGLLTYCLDAFYSSLYNSIRQTAEEMGYWIIQACTDDDDEQTLSLVNSMIASGVEGIIFGSCKLNDPIVEGLVQDGFPVVLANRRMKKHLCDIITVDNDYGAYLIVNHLINVGHRRIGIITASLKTSTSADRYRGYLKALADKGLPIDKAIIRHGDLFARENGYRQGRKLMLSDAPPEAIFCCDEELAMGCMLALKELGLRVPEDVAVVSFDDADTVLINYLQLTTANFDAREMGRLAAQVMVERIKKRDQPLTKVVMEPKLIIRESCGIHLRSS